MITFNTISLELEQSQLRNTIIQFENTLSSSLLPQTEVKELHDKFFSDNNITNSTTNPFLHKPLAVDFPGPSSHPTPATQDSPLSQPAKKRKKRRKKIAIERQTNGRSITHHMAHQPNFSHPLHLAQSQQTPPLLFSQAPPKLPLDLTVHNYSSYNLTHDDILLLNKGLTFSPTPSFSTQELCTQTFKYFNEFAKSLRLK